MNPDGFRGGRTIVIKLKKPVKLTDDRWIRAVEIKGVVYTQQGHISPPLLKSEGSMEIFMDAKNIIKRRRRFLLLGALPFKSAKTEYNIRNSLCIQQGKQYGYAVGYGKYRFTYKGKQFGFAITGVEQLAKDRVWISIFKKNAHLIQKTRKTKDPAGVTEIFAQYSNVLRAYGKELRSIHDAGYYHAAPHILNISWDEKSKQIIFHDFERSKIIKYMSFDKKVGYRLLDIANAYIHFLNYVFEDSSLSEDLYTNNLVKLSDQFQENANPFTDFIKGYFYSEDQINHQELLSSILPCLHLGYLYSIDRLDSSLVTALYKIETEKDPYASGARVLPQNISATVATQIEIGI
jgi:hypothetical protein